MICVVLDLLGEDQLLLRRRLRVERLPERRLRLVELAREHELVERREAARLRERLVQAVDRAVWSVVEPLRRSSRACAL